MKNVFNGPLVVHFKRFLLYYKIREMERKDVSQVELVKDEKYPFGIRFTDGIQGEEGPVIRKVYSKSLAEKCHALSAGDVLLSLNGWDVTGMPCKNIQRMIRTVGSKLHLKLQYQMREIRVSSSGIYRKERLKTKLGKVGDSFGFILRKRSSKNSFSVEFPMISSIKQGSPAHMDGLMHDGDRLLEVDNTSLSWLSLEDIASILMQKTEAEFTFEYNIREVDFSQSLDRIIALNVDLPNIDQGIGLCVRLRESCGIYISNIRKGSVAERCGMFSIGDIIISINDIVEDLTVSDANSLLQCGRKIQSISFISTKGRQLPKPTTLTNSFCNHSDKYITPRNSINALDQDNRNIYTPVSTNTKMMHRKIQHREICQREQVKAIKMFYGMLKNMEDLKQNLSQLTHRAFDDKEMLANMENCTSCNKTQHSIKLCASCISKVNVKCAHSRNLLRNIVAHFIRMSLKQENCLPPNSETQTTNAGNHNRGAALESLMHSLTEILPKVFDDKLELQRYFLTLAQKISNADASCNNCWDKIDFTSLTVQRLLLLISLSDPSTEINVLINQLVYCLLETKLTCETNSPNSPLEENSATESEIASLPRPSSKCSSESEIENVLLNIEGSESDETNADSDQSTLGSISETPHLIVNLNQQSAYFKLIDIQSFSESDSSSTNDQKESSGSSIGIPRNTPVESSGTLNASTLERNLLKKSKKSNGSKEPVKSSKKIYKDKGLLKTPAKIWRSLESILSTNSSPRVQSAARGEFQENSKPSKVKSSDEVMMECSSMDPPQRSMALDAKDLPRSFKRNGSESNHESMESSENHTEKEGDTEKTHTETMQVNMLNDGEGFGFVLGFSSPNFSDTLPVPIITSVKPKSPAYKSGVLAKKDRVLAINGQSVVGIRLKDLEKLKRQIFTSENITLTIEFDVVDIPLKFGKSEVVLDKTLKIGLLFEDMEKGSPMIVSGVVKGSASHRSGKVFPGDKIMLLKCIRNEEFDPISCNYIREETVKITIERETSEGIKEIPIALNPFSYKPGSASQSGKNFIVRNTSIRPAGTNSALVLDQELTLFRDPVSWDFGFLVGENRSTGQAYITGIRPNGPASSSGILKKFDRIVEVNGVAVGRDEACSVLTLLTHANDKVDLLIRRLYRESVDDDASLKLPTFKSPH